MEREPQRGSFKISFENGIEIYCHKDNTLAFLHNKEPYGDHIFVYKTNDANEVSEGDYIFRDQLINFDEVIEMMKQRGYNVYESETGRLTEHDREAYEEYLFKRKPVDLPATELTQRQERFIRFFEYVLQREHIIPADFAGEGDLYI